MEIITVKEYGGSDVLQLDTAPVPSPKEGEVLIKVLASGVNFADIMLRQNSYVFPMPLPFTPGAEVAGTIQAIGEGVDAFKVGDSVFTLLASPTGGYAQYALASAKAMLKLPKDVDYDEATALLVQGLTAYLLLTDIVAPDRSKSVLIHAGAGGVGSLAVQIARQLGMEKVIATSSTDKKLELAKSFGADEAVNYLMPGWSDQVNRITNGKGADLILDMVGADIFIESINCLAYNGTLVNYGNASGKNTSVDINNLIISGKNQSLRSFHMGAYFANEPQKLFGALQSVVTLVESKKIKPHVGLTLLLKEAAHAHHLLETRQTTGKVVLKPWG